MAHYTKAVLSGLENQYMTRYWHTIFAVCWLACAGGMTAEAAPVCQNAVADWARTESVFRTVRLLQVATGQPARLASGLAADFGTIARHESALQRLAMAQQQAFAALAPTLIGQDAAWDRLQQAFEARALQRDCAADDSSSNQELVDRFLLQLEQNPQASGIRSMGQSATPLALVSGAPFVAWLAAIDEAAQLLPARLASEQALAGWQRELGNTGKSLQQLATLPGFVTASRQARTCRFNGIPRNAQTVDVRVRHALQLLASRPLPVPAAVQARALRCDAILADAQTVKALQQPPATLSVSRTTEQLQQLAQTWGVTLIQEPDTALRVPGAATPRYLQGLIAVSRLHGGYADQVADALTAGTQPVWQPWVGQMSCVAVATLDVQLQAIPAGCLSAQQHQTRIQRRQQLQSVP
jgi:hypothetical protein